MPQAVEAAAAGALRQRQSPLATAAGLTSIAAERELKPAPALPQLVLSDTPQRTIQHSTVIYGLGLHSGGRTGMVIQPLPPNSGLHLISLPSGTHIPMHLGSVGDTEYATTLGNDGSEVKTVEHFLSALHAYGISNLLVKVHGELPVLDGSASDFCRTLEQIGIEDQAAPRQELVIDRHYEVSSGKDKILSIDPPDDGEGFSVSYLLRYPPPVGEQFYEFKLTNSEAYKREIAPARTFGFMRDLKMMAELGLGSGGRLDNFILVGEDDVLNTELRFPDEFVRHKILDIIGDLYLIGYPSDPWQGHGAAHRASRQHRLVEGDPGRGRHHLETRLYQKPIIRHHSGPSAVQITRFTSATIRPSRHHVPCPTYPAPK